ncbi:MAG: magnesium/cobalt transporter CorA [Candidatus Omnitrophota bacterium]|nr:magnesium/cobalt transporter CorA [Candidatus Omnitrophota bacterium]
MYENHYYHPEHGFKTGITPEEMVSATKDERAVLWLDVCDIDDNDIDVLTNVFNLHPLTVEDFIMPNTRPKIEEFPDYLFMVIISIQGGNNSQKGKIAMAEVDCCLGRNFLITFHGEQSSSIATCKDRVRKQSPMIMHGADMLLYSILESCIDNYFPIINEFDDMVDVMSDELFKSPDQGTLQKIYNLKNDVMNLRRTIGPQADVIGMLSRGTYKYITPSNIMYFRNLYDNMVRFNDIVGTSRDVISGAMEAYVSIVSNRLNEIMKTLTIIATIMMPLTLIASIYGMNFKHMPELEHDFGYPGVILTMGVITIFMLMFFKRKKWL